MKGSKVDYLVDKHGNLILPRTISEAIADKDSGENLNQMLDGIVRCAGDETEYIEDLEEHTGEVLTRHDREIKNLESAKNELRQEVDEHQAEAVLDDVHGLKPENPINITLLNGWTNQSFGVYGTATYHKDAFGFVHLQGSIKAPSGDRSLTIFNLPQGYRPSHRKHLLVANATLNNVGLLSINNDGNASIVSTVSDGNVISLNTVSFKAGE